ncbi:MAG TPA: cupin domain-containing protein [Syntrophorhabdaceae bacterium]|nr:cupin domain-containing protein [Syntrophorhabdaceae bacterium]
MELKVINMKDVKALEPDAVRKSWLLVSEKTVGAENLSMGINETYPGGMVPEHVHDTEEEINFFFSGRGKLVAEGREIQLEAGVCILIPPKLPHSIVNDGDEVIRFMWILAPQLAGHRK